MRNINAAQFGTQEVTPDHHVYKVRLPEETPLPYDEDPNNRTSPVRPPHAFAKGALRPMRGKPYGREYAED